MDTTLNGWLIIEYCKIHNPDKIENGDYRNNITSLRYVNLLSILMGALDLNYVDYSILVFKTKEVIYTIAYVDENANIKYLALGPPLVSMDGEYRRRFVPYENIVKMCEENSKLFDSLEELIPMPDLEMEYVPAINYQLTTDVISNIAASLDGKKFYYVAMLIHLFYANNNLIENHINKKYTIFDNIMTQYIKIKERFPINKLIKSLVTINFTPYVNVNIEMGQKIIPLSIKEFNEFGNLSHSVWREVYCNKLLVDLFVNNIYPGIPLFAGLLPIRTSRSLFNNESMADRFHQSNLISEAMDDVKKLTNKISLYDTLVAAFENPREIAETNIILSDYSIVCISQYVGRTFADLPAVTKSTNYKRVVGDFFNDIEIFRRYTFDIFYGLYSCNRMGVIHGDLHMNNCTIGTLHTEINESIKNPHISWTIDKETYLFPHCGAVGSLIDFSRAILSPALNSIDPIQSQKMSILNSMGYYFPDWFLTYRLQLEVVCLSHPHHVFRLFTAFDAFVFTKNLAILCERNANTEIQKFANDLQIYCKNKLFEIEHLFHTAQLLDDVEWPMLAIIKEFYSNYNVRNYQPDNPTIVEYYSADNELKYSLSSYEYRPPFLQNLAFDRDKSIYVKTPKELKEDVLVAEEREETFIHDVTRANKDGPKN